jgi:hypothetical protein
MRNLGILLVVALAMATGCSSGGDTGTAPPPAKPLTQAEIDAMPPQARAAMEAAQKRGEEMARNQGKPFAGK